MAETTPLPSLTQILGGSAIIHKPFGTIPVAGSVIAAQLIRRRAGAMICADFESRPARQG